MKTGTVIFESMQGEKIHNGSLPGVGSIECNCYLPAMKPHCSWKQTATTSVTRTRLHLSETAALPLA